MNEKMTRILFFVAALSVVVWAQFVNINVKWTCPKEGRFSVKHCEGCNPHYCMDGQHFHADEGPVPAWVPNSFAEMKRRSEEIGREIDSKRGELRAAHAANVARHASDQEAFLRRVQSGQRGNVPRLLQPALGGVAAAPDLAVAPRIVSTGEISLVKIGDTRMAIVERLGTPESAITIPGEEGMVETLSYRISPDRTARINIRHGRVVEISLP